MLSFCSCHAKITWLSQPSRFQCRESGNEARQEHLPLETVSFPNYFSLCVKNSLGMRLHLSQRMFVPIMRERERGGEGSGTFKTLNTNK